jgi:Vault protein inter-alpha-trypsin domain
MPHQCGIFASDSSSASFPLVGARCHYTVIDVQTVASLVQTYVSNASDPQAVVYVFPLPAEAAVCAFKAVIGGTRIVKGVVQEKAPAKENYEKAVKQGLTAGLLEKQHADGM